MFEDELGSTNKLKSSMETRKKFIGVTYAFNDINFMLVENKFAVPYTISILCKLKCFEREGGVVYSTNLHRNTYQERYCENDVILHTVYAVSKRKILAKDGVFLGWEGGILNDFRWS